MRIGVDAIPLLRSRTTGIQNHARGLCRSLAELAADHQFILPYEKSAERFSDFDPSFVGSLGSNWELVPASVLGPTESAARYLWSAWKLPRLLKRHDVDVYYSPTTRGPYRGDCPAAVTIHDLAREAYGPHEPVPDDVIRLADQAARIFAVSESTARDVRRLLGVPAERLVTIHNGPALGIAPASADRQRAVCEKFDLREGKFLLCVGDENWRRRYDVLWQAMGSLWSTGHVEDVRVVFVGRQDWSKTKLAALVGAGDYADGATFLTDVPEPELSALYSAAAATVMPTEAEGFGVPAIEAMLCNCPVICSDIKVLREVAGDAPRYFDLTIPGSLAVAVQSVLSDPRLRSEMVRRGLERARRYSWRAAAEKVFQTLRALAEQPVPAAP